MGEFSYPHAKSLKGPWLLGRESLEELNEIVAAADKKLRQCWQHEIESSIYQKYSSGDIDYEEIQNKIQDELSSAWNNKHESICEFSSKEDIRIVDTSIAGLLQDILLANFSPTSLEVNITHGGLSSESLSLRINSTYSSDFNYQIKCSNPDSTNEIEYELTKWIEKHKPSLGLTFWSSDLFSFLGSFLIFPVIIAMLYLFLPQKTTYKETIKAEAHSIAESGIEDKNVNRAIELLLHEKFEYKPSSFVSSETAKKPLYIRLSLITIFISIILFIRPRTTIGLGKKKNSYTFYMYWVKFVTVILPVAIVITPFWEKLTSWIYS